MTKRWILVKDNGREARGVYLRDLPSIVAAAFKESFCEWWLPHYEGYVYSFLLGLALAAILI